MKVYYYYPYKSDKPEKKYYIITKSEKKVYFGAAGMSDFTIHKDEDRKNRYIKRHEKNESKFWNKSGIDTASFWALNLLWNKPTIKESYQLVDIQNTIQDIYLLKKKNYISDLHEDEIEELQCYKKTI